MSDISISLSHTELQPVETEPVVAEKGAVATCLYPIPPVDFMNFAHDMDIYVRFMRHLRFSPHSREDIRILATIGFVADMIGAGDADVAGTLIDMGLRVPRTALPASYLMMVDQHLLRADAVPSLALTDLVVHWHRIAEARVPAFPSVH